MKNRKFIVLVAVALLVVISATLVACNTGKGSVSYTVSFVVDGEVKKTAELDNFSRVNGFYKPTKEGYTFDGWYLDANFTEKLSSDSQLKDDLTLYAKFTRKSYTVEFVGADDMIIDSQTVFHGEPAIAPEAPAVSGMKFVGWDVDFTSVTANLTVKALYVESTKFRAEFFSLGALFWSYDFEPGDDINLILNTALDEIVVPEGLRFVKWVTSFDEDVPAVLPNEDIDIVAVYELVDIEYLDIIGNVPNYEIYSYGEHDSVTYTADMPIISGDEYEIFYSYLWTINGVEQTGTSSSLTVSGLDVGSYEIKVVATATATSIGTVSREATLSLTVTPANMTVSAVGDTITYDGQAHNITVNSLPGDVVEYKVEGGDWTSNLELVNAGTYDVYYRVSRENYATYESIEPVTYTIEKKALHGTIAPTTLVYGDMLPTTYDVTITGFVDGEDQSVLSGDIVFVPSVANTLTIGEFAVSANVGGVNATNYTLTVSNGVITVEKKVLTVTASDLTLTYCDSVSEYPLSYSGFIAGDSIDNLDTIPVATSEHTWDSPVGEYEITVGGGEDDHYAFEYVNGTLTVEKKAVTITANDVTVPYGTKIEDIVFTYSPSDLIRDEITVTYTAPEYSVTLGAGNVVDIIPYVESENYEYSFINGKLIVEKRVVTATADDQTVVFGDLVTKYGITFDNMAEGEDPAEVIDTWPNASSNYTAGITGVGTYEIAIVGGSDDNYTFNNVKGTLTVTKRDATITAEDKTIIYGAGLDTVTLTYAQENLVASAPSGVTLEVVDFVENSVPGTTFTIKATSSNENYNFTFTDGTLTVVKKDVTVTVDNKIIVYGEAIDTIDLTYTLTGAIDGDTVVVTLEAVDYVAGAVPGTTFTIKATSTDNRYNFNVTDGTLTVVKKDVTVTAGNATVVYGSEADLSAVTSDVVGLVGEDTIDLTYTTDYVVGDGAGKSFDIVPAGTHDYYNVTFINGELTVLKKDASVALDDASVTYGDQLPTLTAEVTGTVLGDSLVYTISVDYVAGVTAVGDHTITALLGTNNNYDVTVTDGTLTVTKKDVSFSAIGETASVWSNSIWASDDLVSGHLASGTLTLTATDLGTYTYPDGFDWTTAFDIKAGEDSVLSNYNVTFNVTVALIERDFEFTAEDKYVTYNGAGQSIEVSDVVLSEDASSQNYTVEYKVGDGEWSTTVPTFENAGNYAVSYRITPEDSIYYPDAAEGTFTLHIAKAEVTVIVDSKVKTYGEATPVFTGTVEGVVPGDTVEINYLLTNNAVDKNAGEYTITAQFATAQDNYTLKVDTGTLTVNQKAVTITADNMTITYGDAVNFNAHTYTHNGIVSGDTVDVTYTTDYTTGANAGTYTITPVLNGTYSNYVFSLVPGTLTVSPKAASITTLDKTIAFGDSVDTVELQYVIEGVLEGDEVEVTVGVADFVANMVPGTTFGILASANNGNYSFTYHGGTLTVVKKDVTITANNAMVVYGNAFADNGFTAAGIVEGSTVEITLTAPDYVVGANAGETFKIIPSSGEHTLYNFTFVNGTLTVAQRPATVTAGNLTITYGDVANLTAYEITGLLDGDSATVSLSTDYLAGSGVGTYAIVPHANNSNYAFTAVNGTLTVNPKDATVSVDSKTVTYGDALPTLTITTTGVLAGDTLGYTFDHNYAPGATGVGTVDVAVTLGENPNYNVTVLSAGAITVTKRNVTVTADNKNVVYGDAVPSLTATVNNEVAGYPVIYTLGTTYTAGANAGQNFDITVSLGANPNYNVTAVDGTLTVAQRPATVTADSKSITYGDALDLSTVGYTVIGLLNDDTLDVSLTTLYSTGNNAGTYPITPVVSNASANYAVTIVNGTLTVNKAHLDITNATQVIETSANSTYTFNKDLLVETLNGVELADSFEYVGIPTYEVASTYQFTATLSHVNYEGSVLCTFIIKSVDVGGTLYTIEDALNVATSGNVIVKANTAFSSVVGYYNGSQYYTVKSGVTLLLPYKDGDTTGWINGGKAGSTEYNSHPNVKNGDSITPVLYVTLDIPSSVTLNVSGTLTVGAKTGIQDAGTKQNNVTGGYGQINLSGNIVVNSATLNVYGYIKGTGKITATGSTAVTENMYLSGWMGGSISAARFIGTASGKSVLATTFISSGTYTVDDPTMFPFNQYELRAIQTTLELQYGTSLRGIIKIATSEQKVDVPLMGSIGADAAVNQGYFNIVSSSTDVGSALIRMLSAGAKVTKSFGNDRVRITTDGTIADGYADISTNVISKTVKLTSEKVIFPIDGRIDLVINSGTFTQNYQYKLLPGATLTVNSGATLTSNNTLITYKNGFTDIATYPYPTNRGDAKIVVAGTLNANKAIGGDVFGVTGGKLVVGASTTVTSVKSLEGTGTMARSGLNMVFTFSESNSQVRDLTLNGTTKGSAGTTYTYNGSAWA